LVAGGDDTQKLATSLAGPTFRKKWSIGPRRCPMLAVADAEAAAALRELGATLRGNGAASPYTLARFPSRLLTFWEGVKGVMPARLSRQTDTRADSHALAIWLTSQTYCFVIMHVSVLFGGLFLASPLPLSPEYNKTFTRPLELLFKRASPLTCCLNTCSSARLPTPPPAPRSISKYSLRPEPRRPASYRSYMKDVDER
jgi:hypothetical protein